MLNLNKRLVPVLIAFFALFSQLSYAQIISATGQEVELSFKAKFILELGEESDLETAADDHSSYLMGVIKSKRFVESMDVSYEESEGIGAPRFPHRISGLRTRILNDGRTELTYHYRAKALIHNSAAQLMIQNGSFEVVMPYDFEHVYDKNCTDTHYDSLGDYWYFWDPYREGCEKLLEEPATKNTLVKVKKLEFKKITSESRFDALRSNNGNGKLFQIDLITGFDEGPNRRDIGWKIFRTLNKTIENEFGLELVSQGGTPKNPMYIYEQVTESGLHIKIRHLLVDTAIDSRSKAFAKFFKNSVETSDVVVYSGHSGLGGNLDIPSLEEKAGAFSFNPNKRQLFYFNSCSSYSYYLDHFRVEKTKAKIDVLSNALAAYMDEGSEETVALLKILLDESRSPEWIEVLEEMEASNAFDMTYLLNVGGV